MVLCNLKPANMRGVKSHAMVMCATGIQSDGTEKTELLVPPAECQPGDLVTFEGYERNPDSQLNPKKKIFEKVQPGFFINDTDPVARYREDEAAVGAAWRVVGRGEETIRSATVLNALIK